MYQPQNRTLGATQPVAAFNAGDFSKWVKFATGPGASEPIVTLNAAAAPDGSMTAARVVFNRGSANAGNSGAYSILRINPQPLTVGQTYTNSVYLKLTPGAAAARLGLRSVASGGADAEQNVIASPTDQWQRFAVVSPPLMTQQETWDLLLWDNALRYPSPGTTQVADVLMWGARVDLGTVPQGPDYSSSSGKLSPLAMIGIAGLVVALLDG